jgi:hypothetical protein
MVGFLEVDAEAEEEGGGRRRWGRAALVARR